MAKRFSRKSFSLSQLFQPRAHRDRKDCGKDAGTVTGARHSVRGARERARSTHRGQRQTKKRTTGHSLLFRLRADRPREKKKALRVLFFFLFDSSLTWAFDWKTKESSKRSGAVPPPFLAFPSLEPDVLGGNGPGGQLWRRVFVERGSGRARERVDESIGESVVVVGRRRSRRSRRQRRESRP